MPDVLASAPQWRAQPSRFQRFAEPEALAQDPAALRSLLPVDVRSVLSGPEDPDARFAEARLPGSILLPFRSFFAAEPDPSSPSSTIWAGGRTPWPDATELRRALLAAGLRPSDPLLFWDAGATTFASRAVILARAAGFLSARALAGGLAAWKRAGLPVERGEPAPAACRPLERLPKLRPARLAVEPKPGGKEPDEKGCASPGPSPVLVSAEALRGELARGRAFVIDARTPAAFTLAAGAAARALDPPGRIPGSVNRPASANFGTDGRLKEPAVLRREFLGIFGGWPAGAAVHACGSGIAACLNLLAAAEAGLASIEASRLYPGGWSEWSRRPGFPKTVGPD